jgi:hypothetical protein
MAAHEHGRWQIFNPAQHPLVHDISSMAYGNPRIPGISLLGDTLDYIIAVLYPKYIGTFADQAALAAYATPQPNDYAIVSDDGDGKAAGYVYSVIDNLAQWVKRYDVDWSMENILAETVNRTEYMYVHKYGMTDRDQNANPFVGDLAGQRIYGGDTAGQHLILYANSGDTVGRTGYVQFGDDARPLVDNTFTLGTATYRFTNVFSRHFKADTMDISAGSIADSSGAITFGAANLSTTGTLASGTHTIGTLTLAAGAISDSGGTINFGATNLTTTGAVAAGTAAITTSATVSNLTFSAGSISSGSGSLSFGATNLATTGTLSAGNTTVTRLDSGNIRLSGNTISIQNAGGNLILQANGAGVVDVQSAMTTLGQTVTGVVSITGQLNADNLRLDGNVISSTDLNGNITLTPNGAGLVESSATLFPTTTATEDLGKSGNIWRDIYFSGSLKNATQAFANSDLMALRNNVFRDAARTQPAQAGDALFYDAVSGTWLASVPDTEITHSTLSGLTTGDAGHTQFALLAGRAGGQSLVGGTAASENLTFDSTAHATKGLIQFSSPLAPTTTASFSSSWSGTDIGTSSKFFRDVYTKGEFKGLRLENVLSSGLPGASAQNAGRLVFATDNDKIYVDTGGSWIVAGVSKYLSDTSWNGAQTTQTFTTSASIADARNAIWAIHDNSNNFERIYAKIEAISATQVRVTVSPALPAGSYRLIGIE